MRAKLPLTCQQKRLVLTSQAFCLTLPKTWDKQKVRVRVLRAFSSPDTGTPRVTDQPRADVFGDEHRQHIPNWGQEFEQAGEELRGALPRPRNVDASKEMLNERNHNHAKS